MKGPFQYFEKRLTGENTLVKVLASEDQPNIKGVRAIAGLMTALFATITFYAAKDGVEHALEAYRTGDAVTTGAEAFAAVGDTAVDIFSGWTAVEMAVFAVNSTQRIKELNDA